MVPVPLDLLRAPDPGDSNARFSFRTRLSYLSSLAFALETEFPTPADIGSAFQATVVPKKVKPPISNEVSSMLVAAWNTEALVQQSASSGDLADAAAQWVAVMTYYAAYSSSRAWMLMRGQNDPKTHQGHLRALPDPLRAVGVYPLSVFCISERPETWEGDKGHPVPPSFHTIELPSKDNYESLLKKGLLYARREALVRRRAVWLHENKPKKQWPPAERLKADQSNPTTFLHLLWELRMDANYDDPVGFMTGGVGWDDSQRFVQAAATVVEYANRAFEASVRSMTSSDSFAQVVRRLPRGSVRTRVEGTF